MTIGTTVPWILKKPPINFKLFYEPLKHDRKPYSVSNHFLKLTPLYISLLKDLISWIRQPRTIRIGKTKIIITLLWALLLWPAPDTSHVFADDMGLKKAATPQVHKPITADLRPLEPIKPVVVARKAPPAPKPVQRASNCVTGYQTGINSSLDKLIMRESGGRSCVVNHIGCVGLLQACPGSKLYAVCPTLEVNCQINFFTGYMKARYGSWEAALAHSYAKNWW